MADAPIPLIVYGDGPRLPSGLARIARDLCARLQGTHEELGISLIQLGVDPPDGLHWQGWDLFGFQPHEGDQGRGSLRRLLQLLPPDPEPVVWMIMDPSRCFDLTREQYPGEKGEALPAVHFWGYFPIDSENVNGAITGPAAEAVNACERVLGYGKYGAQVLKRSIAHVGEGPLTVPYLPHGLEPVFHSHAPLSDADEGFQGWRTALYQGDPAAVVIGCVATNQPRKDLSLLFSAGSLLRQRGVHLAVWLHTDRQTNSWDIGTLAKDFGWPRSLVCISTAEGQELTDYQLAARYCASTVTLAPGLGEGFGYPIVESLACGRPVVHVKYAGGVELLPHGRWLVEPRAWRLEGCYAIKRPVLAPEDVAAALTIAIEDARKPETAAFCSGSVAHLQWGALWPRWYSWVAKGLRAIREQAAAEQRRQARLQEEI